MTMTISIWRTVQFSALALCLAAAGAGTLALRPVNAQPAMGNGMSAPSTDNILTVAGKAGTFNTLAAAIKAAELDGALSGAGPFTVFAPTDEAFAKIPKKTLDMLLMPENKAKLQAILKYHVVAGNVPSSAASKLTFAPTLNGQRAPVALKDGALTIGGAKIIKTDIGASNGVIHVIDRVIMPADADIVDTAVKAKLNTLVAAVKAAGLVEALKSDNAGKGFTVLAPTDEAFAKLPSNVLASLLKPENKDALVSILKYHVIPSRVYADAAGPNAMPATLQGANVAINIKDGTLMAGSAKVLKTDVETSNGVVHVIDSVLLPPGFDPSKLVAGAMNTGRAMPSDVIAMAIERGVPMFNSHNAQGCAAVYEVAMTALMAMDDKAVPGEVKNQLQLAMEKGSKQHSMSDRAWTYRKALDSAMELMSNADAR
jgi:uncharacterized surface protein with fasciclin (FAS1) repeats